MSPMRMPWSRCFTYLASCLGLAGLLLAAPGASPVQADENGFAMSLFDGESLDRWVVTDCEVDVVDGALRLKEGNGLVRSHHRYGDFIFELEWKALGEGEYDSGVYIRAELPEGKATWPKRYQVNLKKGLEGAVTPLNAPTATQLVKPGEWNKFRITVQGDRAKLEVNGQTAWDVRGLEPAHGYVGLQAEVPLGGQFLFRNLKIVELGARSLFNGQDLTGWEGGSGPAESCWKVEEGLLLCTGEKGPWLRSMEEYGDFNLRLDYRLREGGNSGVYVRVPKNGAHRGGEANEKQAGVEIQLLDDHAKRYANLKPYQYSGSVYAIAAPEPRVSRPAGEWNTIEIDCRENRYRITHNGHVVVDADVEQYPELANRLTSGFLGLQNHSEEVWFRNLRIGPSLK